MICQCLIGVTPTVSLGAGKNPASHSSKISTANRGDTTRISFTWGSTRGHIWALARAFISPMLMMTSANPLPLSRLSIFCSTINSCINRPACLRIYWCWWPYAFDRWVVSERILNNCFLHVTDTHRESSQAGQLVATGLYCMSCKSCFPTLFCVWHGKSFHGKTRHNSFPQMNPKHILLRRR